ncbi:MAG TPA: hypothetical protein VGF48_24375 [Thermoanaerobaculia bacterium]|jgi:hypothetical protein
MRPVALGLAICLGAATLFAADSPIATVMRDIPARQLESLLRERPEQIPPILRNLGEALMSGHTAAEPYLASLALARAERLGTTFTRDDLRTLVAFMTVDPVRYRDDATFRTRINALLPKTLAPSVDYGLREAALVELNALYEIDYALSESLANAWKLAPRSSTTRRSQAAGSFRDDAYGTIDATILSLNSAIIAPNDARAFLTGLRKSAPKRRILVLADPPMRASLHDLDVTVIDTFARPFTPWPRDPFAVTSAKDGGVVFVNRPNQQPNREDDAHMIHALIAGMPSSLDKEWKPRWSVAPFPFHNGHVLVLPEAAWISIHTVEIRALALLGIARVPVETFHTAAGIQRYVTAVKRAAKELETLYGRPTRFVHPLPGESEPLAQQVALMQSLGGGGGFDLDSIVTLLPGGVALVGDLTRGAALARKASWSEAHRAYGFTGEASTLGARVAEVQTSGRAPGLQTFLDAVALHLARSMKVERIPLLDVPYALLSDANAASGSDFLMTWHNVVLEGKRAQGFAALLPEGDAAAREAFQRAGFTLDLLPPLVRSIVLNGGFRCASNHVRR